MSDKETIDFDAIKAIEPRLLYASDEQYKFSVLVDHIPLTRGQRDALCAELDSLRGEVERRDELLRQVLVHPTLALGVAVRNPRFSEEDDRGEVRVVGYDEEPEGRWRRAVREVVGPLRGTGE